MVRRGPLAAAAQGRDVPADKMIYPDLVANDAKRVNKKLGSEDQSKVAAP